MAVYFTHDGKELDVDDVPMDVYADIEKKTGIAWYRLTQAPAGHAAAGPLLAQRCADMLEVVLPDPITPKVLVDLFDVREDDVTVPSEFEDGMPDPKAEGIDRETT